ncbi:MAG TPA: PspA/IM30 family protein [Pseudomonadales bacterium]|nr:PspA/IM30 family protein [Pseudomonadales bacterium]
MALINRMSRLFTADLHAVIDRLEEPDVLLKQAIREMEDELALRDHRIRLLDHEREQCTQQAADIDRELARTAEQLDVCFDSGEEQLARTLLKRRLEMEHIVARLRTRADATTKALAEEHAQLDEQRRAFDSLRQQAEALLQDLPPVASHSMPYQPPVTDNDVEVALLQEKQRRSRS